MRAFPYRPPDLDIPLKPNEGLSSHYGCVITNQRADIVAVQDWLVYVQRLLWELDGTCSSFCLMAWLVVWRVALSSWHFSGHWSLFAHFTRHLGCDGLIRAFGGSAAWSVVSSVLRLLRVAGSGWWLVWFVFPPFWFWGGCFRGCGGSSWRKLSSGIICSACGEASSSWSMRPPAGERTAWGE